MHARARRAGAARDGAIAGSPFVHSRFRVAGSTFSGIDEEAFQSLLEQVRELHRLADEITLESNRLHANVRARLSWDRDAPPLPPEQRKIADEAVDALSTPRLSSAQSRLLQRAFFGR